MSRTKIYDELIWREWDEAWEHSRHLESMRSQYLGFFFTALLATVGVVGSFFAKQGGVLIDYLAVSAGLIFGLNILTGFLYVAVLRINELLTFYMHVILRIRDRLGKRRPKGGVKLTDFARPPKASVGSTSKSATGVLLAGLLACSLALIAIAVKAFSESADTSLGLRLACVIVAILSLTVLVIVAVRTPPSAPHV